MKKVVFLVFLLILTVMLMTGCGVQSIPTAKNETEASLAEVVNQYKRRADLVPNLVQVVKGYASHEKATLTEVIEARAKATSINLDLSKMSPEKLQEYSQSQGALTQALSKLMVVSERYPDLKANETFLTLQAQLEGTENRITVARRRYIDSIKSFNNLVTVPPTSWTNSLLYKYPVMPQWNVDEQEKKQIETAPTVQF